MHLPSATRATDTVPSPPSRKSKILNILNNYTFSAHTSQKDIIFAPHVGRLINIFCLAHQWTSWWSLHCPCSWGRLLWLGVLHCQHSPRQSSDQCTKLQGVPLRTNTMSIQLRHCKCIYTVHFTHRAEAMDCVLHWETKAENGYW